MRPLLTGALLVLALGTTATSAVALTPKTITFTLYSGPNLVNIPLVTTPSGQPFMSDRILTECGGVAIGEVTGLNFGHGRVFIPGYGATPFQILPKRSYRLLMPQRRLVTLSGAVIDESPDSYDPSRGVSSAQATVCWRDVGFPLGVPHLMTWKDLIEWPDNYGGTGTWHFCMVTIQGDPATGRGLFRLYSLLNRDPNPRLSPGQGAVIFVKAGQQGMKLPTEASPGCGYAYSSVGRAVATTGYPDDAPDMAWLTPMNHPEGVRALTATNPDFVAYADRDNHALMFSDGMYSKRLAGKYGGVSGAYRDMEPDARQAALNSPEDLEYTGGLPGSPTFIFVDTLHHVVRNLTSAGSLYTMAGTGAATPSGEQPRDDIDPRTTTLSEPCSVIVTGNYVYVADRKSRRIRRFHRVPPPNQIRKVSTVAGGLTPTSNEENLDASQATFAAPQRIAAAPGGTRLYVADSGRCNVRCIQFLDTATPTVTTAMGSSNQTAPQSGTTEQGALAANALLMSPVGVTVDPQGCLYVSDTAQKKIYRVGTFQYRVSEVAGSGSDTAGDLEPMQTVDANALARSKGLESRGLHAPFGPEVHFSDRLNNRIRRVIGRP